MKTYIFRLCLLFGMLSLLNFSSFGQDQIKGTKQRLDITLDDFGNAHIAVTMKLNASQWDMFKKTLGNNTSNLKREMIKGMPKFYLTDFKYNEDQMERTYTLEMRALAVASVDKNGKWKAALDAKDPDIMKVNENQFKLDANYVSGGGLIEQTQQIYLPGNAKNAKVEKDSFGKAVLTYQTGSGLMNILITGAGILFIIAGAVLFYFNRMRTPKYRG